MTSTGLYTLIAAAAVVGGYALYRREKRSGSTHVGWSHTVVDYQNPSDSVTDQRYERNFFVQPYQIFCPGGEIRPFEVDAHGQPTGRQLVMPGESPTVGNPADYIMVGFHPHGGFGHGGQHGLGRHALFEAEQAALAEQEAEALAAAQLAQDPAIVTGAHFGHGGFQHGFSGRHLWAAEQAQAQAAALAQMEADALAAEQLGLDPLAASAATMGGDFATGLSPAISMMMRRRMMGMGGMGGMGGGGGGMQQLLQQQQLQNQILQQQLAQAQADALAAQQLAAQQAAVATTAVTPAVVTPAV